MKKLLVITLVFMLPILFIFSQGTTQQSSEPAKQETKEPEALQLPDWVDEAIKYGMTQKKVRCKLMSKGILKSYLGTIDTPFIHVAIAANEAKRKMMAFTRKDVTKEMLEPVVRIFFKWPGKEFSQPSAEHAVIKKIKSPDPKYVTQPLKVDKIGFTTDKMKVASLFRDEQTKLKLPKICYYCGGKEKLSLDHIIPRKKGGPDSGDNLIFSCRKCNSSKGSKDLMEWMESKDRFPTILVLRRYLKLVIRFCSENNLLNKPLSELDTLDLPVSIKKIPLKYPKLKDIKLWVTDLDEYQNRIDYL